MDNISKTSTAVITDNKSITSYLDDSTPDHPIANKFIFKYKGNKYKFHLSGGSPKPYTGLHQWRERTPHGPLELLTTFAYFSGMRQDKYANPILGSRKELLPYDNTPMSPIYSEFGMLSQISSELLLILSTNKMGLQDNYEKNKSAQSDSALNAQLVLMSVTNKNYTIEQFIQDSQYTLFNEARLYYEKFIPVINDNKKIDVLRSASKFTSLCGSINYFDPETGEKNCIGSFGKIEFPKKSRKVADLMDFNLKPKYLSEKPTVIKINNRGFAYINTTDRYQLVKTGLIEYIVKPYGIILLNTDKLSAYIYPYIYIHIDNINDGKDYNIINKLKPNNIDGINVRNNSNYYFNNGISRGQIGKSTQVGPIYFKDKNFGPKQINGGFRLPILDYIKYIDKDKKNPTPISKHFDMRYRNKEVYYKETDELEYKNAILKNGYYVTHDGIIIGEEAFVVLETEIEYNGKFLYNRDFVQENGRLQELKLGAIHPRGLELYGDFKGKTAAVCPHNALGNISTLNYSVWDIADIYTYTDKQFEALSYKTNDVTTHSLAVTYLPGLKADDGMIVKGGGIIEATDNLDDTIFQQLRTYRNRKDGIGVYYIVEDNNEDKIILFPTTHNMDTFVNVESQADGPIQCGNPKKIGDYNIVSHGKNALKLFTGVGAYTPTGNNLKFIHAKITGVKDKDKIDTFSDSCKPGEPLVGNIRPNWFYAVSGSHGMEFIDQAQTYSYYLKSNIVIIDELGIILQDPTNIFSKDYTVSIIKDKGIRGAVAKDGDTEISVTISNNNGKKKISLEIKHKDKGIYSQTEDYIPFYVPTKEDPTFKDFASGIPRSNFAVRANETGPIGFVWEKFLNYLVDNGILNITLTDIDETNGMINDSDIVLQSSSVAEGNKVQAFLNSIEVPVINYPAASYYMKHKQAFPVYGQINLAITADFLLHPIDADTNEDVQKQLIDMSADADHNIHYSTDLFSPVNIQRDFRLFFDSELLILGDKTFPIPKDQRVMAEVYLGNTNIFHATSPFNTQDNVYSKTNGVIWKNTFDTKTKAFDIAYKKIDLDISLNRDINIDTTEQTEWFSSFYNNAKAQLVQDMREDTYSKRLAAQYIDASFDTSEIFKQIKTINAKLWNIPVNFRCSNIPDELELNVMLPSEYMNTDTLTFDDLFNQMGSKVIFFDNTEEVTMSVENTYLESDYNASYDVTDVLLRITNKEFLYNDDNIKSYVVNANISKKDAK